MKPEELKSEFRNLVSQLKDALATENKQAVDKINDRMDKIELEVQKSAQPASSAEQKNSEVVSQFKDAVGKFFQNDRHSINKIEVKEGYHPSLSKSDNMVRFDFESAGALLLPAQISDEIIKDFVEMSPVMELARVTPTNRSEYKRRVRTSTPGGRWLDEDAENEKGKIKYAQISIPPHKWAAQYAVTIEQMQDTGYDLVAEMTQAFREDAGVDLGNAFLQGDGINKPTGMVGRITNYNMPQLELDPSNLIQAQEELKDAYHANASWLFSRATRGAIRTKFLGTDGLQYLWEPSFKAGIPTLLLGAPVFIARDGDLAGADEDSKYEANDVFAIYGDFSQGYEVVRHTDFFLIDDMYSEASSFVRNYHIMARFGGNVIKPEALVQLTATGS